MWQKQRCLAIVLRNDDAGTQSVLAMETKETATQVFAGDWFDSHGSPWSLESGRDWGSRHRRAGCQAIQRAQTGGWYFGHNQRMAKLVTK